MIGVAGRDGLGPIQEFIDFQMVGGFPHIVDESGEIWSGFDVRSQPAFIFINDDGTVSDPTGSLNEEELNIRMQALVDS